MLRAWTNGDEPAIAKAFADDKDLTPHLREVLLRRRNASWAQWLKTRLETPGVVFVAVGAGHLAGPLSVQNMLAAEGVAVERIWNKPVPNRTSPSVTAKLSAFLHTQNLPK